MTVPTTANVLLRGQLAYLREHGFDVTVISSPGPELELVARREGVRVVEVPMTREIDLRGDPLALARMTRELRRLRPHIVNASTAKAGLAGMLAAAALAVPIRVYLLRGLRLETEAGVRRAVLGLAERAAARCAHEVICVSASLRERFVAAGYAPATRCRVLGAGSSNGFDVERFTATPARRAAAATLRRELGIPDGAAVIGFVGRPVLDKGIRELLAAFAALGRRHADARLVLVGGGFAGDHVDPDVARTLAAMPNAIAVGRVDEPAPYYALMDVLAFPSYREGFPNAPMEAAIAGVPTVAARATGAIDAIRDGETGLLVPPRAAAALATALERYVADPALRARHGASARARVVSELSRERVWALWLAEYRRLLDGRGRATMSS